MFIGIQNFLFPIVTNAILKHDIISIFCGNQYLSIIEIYNSYFLNLNLVNRIEYIYYSMQNQKNEILEEFPKSISTMNEKSEDEPYCARFVDAMSEMEETIEILKDNLEKLTLENQIQSETLESQRKEAIQQRKQSRSSLLAKEEQLIELKEYYQKQIDQKDRQLELQKRKLHEYVETIQNLQRAVSNLLNQKNLMSKKCSDLNSQNEELHIQNQYFEIKISSLMKQNEYLLNVNERFKKKLAVFDENNCFEKQYQFLQNAQQITFDQHRKNKENDKTPHQEENLPYFPGTKQLYTSINDTNSFEGQCAKISKNYFEDSKEQSKQCNKENEALDYSNPNISSNNKKNKSMKRLMSNGIAQSSLSKRKLKQSNNVNNNSDNSIRRQLFSKSGELFSKGVTDTAILKLEQNYAQNQLNQIRTPRLTHASFSIGTNLSKSARKVFENILIKEKNTQEENCSCPQKQFYTIKRPNNFKICSQIQFQLQPQPEYFDGQKLTVDPYQAFFNLTVQSLKLNYGNLQEIIDLDLSSQWPSIKSKIPYNKWNQYLKQKLIALKNEQKLARQRWSIQRLPKFFSKTS